MAKKIDKKEIKYDIERIRPAMDRNKLNELYNKFKSDDDYLSYHMDVIDDTHFKYKITIVNDEYKSPIKNSDEDKSIGYMDVEKASEFIEECINENRVSSKPKAVMQNGFSRKAVERYNDIVAKEKEECSIVNNFTKPSFEDVMNNIYMNPYNGSTYNMKENELPDDLREDVGVIIPGMIETKEEYFEFVKRLKDRGKNGLGRSIYDRYEDYEEAKELIERYKQALFDKYGSKENYFYARDMGGMFGAYEFYPTVKPRFKKTMRNIKLDKGMNLNELALVKDMGRRIREEYEDEINQINVDGYNYTMYENTPPKFKDLPEDLQLFYKTDKYGINGFTHTDKFLSIETYANSLIQSSDPDKQLEGYRIIENLKYDAMVGQEQYEPEFVDIVDMDELSLNSIVSQMEYDKLIYETQDSLYVDSVVSIDETYKAYKQFVEQQVIEITGLDPNTKDKTKLNELVTYATNYGFSKEYREKKEREANMNSVAEKFYKEDKPGAEYAFGENKREYRSKYRNGDNKLTAYVRDLSREVKKTLQNNSSNADNVNMRSTMPLNDATGYDLIDKNIDGFALEPNPKELLKYMKDNELLAAKIYEISSDESSKGMFSERTNIDDFVSEAKNASKPMISKEIIENGAKSIRKGGKVYENKNS